jgi:hypothetical protein
MMPFLLVEKIGGFHIPNALLADLRRTSAARSGFT